MMRALATLLVFAAAPAAAIAEPLIAVSDDAMVSRAGVGPVSSGTGDRRVGFSFRGGALANLGLLAGDLGAGVERTAGASKLELLPSVGVKFKVLSTPRNMGYTYVYLGLRTSLTNDDTDLSPALGARDFITYDIAGRLAFALQWHALLTLDELSGGVAVGVAHAEETSSNVAVLVGWRRDLIDTDKISARADGVYVSLAHQWLR